MSTSRLAGAPAAVLLCGLLVVPRTDVLAADDSGAPPPGAPRCEIAVVSPVSGFAECVKPHGAPVDPPPARPPPTQEACARHADLGLKECQAATPQAPGG